ncbi:hypothetical protein acsn021_05280 [Anaerocolumna cellulosilytica]|uniref:Uncharacterized protein n=1 Tax=Anaerocolumna cellulosilytica TaxID=433286 RepID=A0A6S6QV55_9FIRM|nr:hypothetical protein [Anaerocolumna cellulosilytica]MBB5195705.1 hypothetical protein [Anaerocolumna cellulosilytica]BCJ92959.1 hypothetical protein acsn021_05280 [Anaerocolumna cellulosilytica]
MIRDDGFVKEPALWFEVACIESGKLWFVAGIGNGLFEMDLNTEEVSFLGLLPEEENDKRRLIGSIIKYEDTLVMAPFNGNSFYQYDLLNKNFSKIDCELKGAAKFFCGKKYGKDIYFIGYLYPVIAKYNVEEQKIIYFSEFQDDILQRIVKKDESLFRDTACIRDDILIIPSCQSNFLLLFNLTTNTFKINYINDGNHGFNAIIEDNDRYYLISRRGKQIYQWDYDTNDSTIITEYSDRIINKIECYGYAVGCRGKTIIVDLYSSNGVVIDNSNKKLTSFTNLLPVEICKNNVANLSQSTLWIGVFGEKIYYFSVFNCYLYELNLCTKEIHRYKIELTTERLPAYLQAISTSGNVLFEEMAYCGINNFLKFPKNKNGGNVLSPDNGNKIYNKIKGLLIS